MYISTEINSFRAYGDDKQVVKLLKDAGFTAYDFSMFGKGWLQPNELLASDDYLEKAKELRAYADGIGLPCNQAHAPFPTCLDEDYALDSYKGKRQRALYRSKGARIYRRRYRFGNRYVV